MRFWSLLLFILATASSASTWNLDKHSIPVDEIMSGGPPKDGIPALMNPNYVSAAEATYLREKEQVIGVNLNGDTRAYPLRIMSWHELVNDRIGDLPILVSWWPLAYAGAVFVRNIDGNELTFGVSGLLYKNNILMYDHQTESLWLQVKRKAVSGPMTGTKLEKLDSTITSWEKWRKRFPHTKVLSLNTGYTRDYSKDPYSDYYKTKKGFFSFLKPGPGEKKKELIIGIEISGIVKGYRLEMLREKKEIRDKIFDKTIALSYDDETDSVKVKDQEGKVIDFILTYWMVWDGIYPETEVYE